ncbi:hypothetical protein [Mesorhizobium sp.]|uniref:hypothetical protein n=1 Tax=Mesorhizobium sp. TaxID=1871066 RepID=UPI000FE9D313|nr:hypothetical protein [Mesorhizobium sp.]RWM08949.1 MAG: hypothetical protein EOR71_10570 [Mesorhizobium sp.]
METRAAIRRAAAILAASPDSDARSVGEALKEALAGDDGRLQTFGLRLDQSTASRLGRRDEELRAAATAFGLDAVQLAEMLSRYFAAGWQRESGLSECPAARIGKVEQHLWAALKAWPRPVHERQLRNVLRGNDGRF